MDKLKWLDNLEQEQSKSKIQSLKSKINHKL